MAVARVQLPPQIRRGEVIEVRLIVQHPMETGFRYDAYGRRTPRNVIRRVVCRYNGVVVFEGTLSSGISANPYLRFFTRAVESGELEFTWIDDKDETGKLSARVTLID